MGLGLDNHLLAHVCLIPFRTYCPILLVHCRSAPDNGIILAEITCPDLANPINGTVEIQANTPGGSAVYSCNRGISLIGTSVRMCNTNGTWSGSHQRAEV